MITTPEWGCYPGIQFCSMGQDPTTVQVDYRVDRSLTMCRCYYLLRMLRSDGL